MRNSTWRVAVSMSAIALLTVVACAAKVTGTAAPTAAVGPDTVSSVPSTSSTRTAATSGTTTSGTTTRTTTTSRPSISIPTDIIPTNLDITSALNDLTSALSGLSSGDFPDNWPDGVTLPPGAKITFSFGLGSESVLTFTTGASPRETFALMDPQIIRAGWSQVGKDVVDDYASGKYTKGNQQLELDVSRLGDSTQGSVSIQAK